jgi:hypothetical protein
MCIKLNIEVEFEDTKGVIRIHKSKNRQHNGQQKKYKQWSTKHTHKAKDRVTRTPLKQVNSGAPEGSAVPAPLVEPIVLI